MAGLQISHFFFIIIYFAAFSFGFRYLSRNPNVRLEVVIWFSFFTNSCPSSADTTYSTGTPIFFTIKFVDYGLYRSEPFALVFNVNLKSIYIRNQIPLPLHKFP